MNAPAPAVRTDTSRLLDLADLVGHPSFELGPLDVRDLRAALEELAECRRTPADPSQGIAWDAVPVPSSIAQGLRDAALAAGPGPLAERLGQAASAVDVLCGAIVAALLRGDVADCALGDLLRAALVTAGAK